MFKAFKYRLHPSCSHGRLLEQTLEMCRRWYNICLEERQTAWEKRRERIGKYDQLRKAKDLKDTENNLPAQLFQRFVEIGEHRPTNGL